MGENPKSSMSAQDYLKGLRALQLVLQTDLAGYDFRLYVHNESLVAVKRP